MKARLIQNVTLRLSVKELLKVLDTGLNDSCSHLWNKGQEYLQKQTGHGHDNTSK